METLFEMGFANALTVAVLAPLAWIVCRITKRPAWSHAVWLIVLLKLVTPPLVRVPIGPAFAREDQPVANRVAGDLVPQDPGSSHAVEPPHSPLAASAPAQSHIDPQPGVSEYRVPSHPVGHPIAHPIATPPTAWPRVSWPRVSWTTILASVWLAGSASWMLLASWRIVRFARLIRSAPIAPESIVQWAETLSDGLGLRRAPIVVLVKSRVSPMVWSLGGRSRLVIPEALWDRLDDDQKAAMLVHELAHLKRGDPWVRMLEMIATGLYWWHPAMWLARKELHRAEEACCDLWVVWALPKAKRQYASALVEAVDFLSESRPMRLPLGASGMGQVEDLSRRIKMIMRSDMPRGLSRFGTLTAVILAAMLLPWRPSAAQQDPAKPAEKPSETKRVDAGSVDPTSTEKVSDKAKVLKIEDVEFPNLAGASPKLRSEWKRAKDRLVLSRQMRENGHVSASQLSSDEGALEKIRFEIIKEKKLLEDAPKLAEQERKLLQSHVDVQKAGVAKAEAQRQVAAAQNARMARHEKRGPGFVSLEEKEHAQADLAIAQAGVAEAKAMLAEAELKLANAAERSEIYLKDAAPRDVNQRIDELESKLESILKEIKDLRRDAKPLPDTIKPRS